MLYPRWEYAGIIGIAIVLAACSGDSTGPQTPASLTASSSASVSGTVGATVTPVPAVVVKDASGKTVSNTLVSWRVVSGNGSIGKDSSRSNASGIADVGSWKLGNSAGVQEIEATVSGAGTVRFSAQAQAGAPSRLTRLSAETQTGQVGETVQAAPSVRVEDSYGNPVPGIQVSFTVVSGGGSIQGGAKTADGSGVATVDSWILGPVLGQQLLRASAGSSLTTFSVTAAAGPPVAMEIVAGDNQTGVSRIAFATAPTVRVLDQFGNPVGGVTVEFVPGENSGTVGADAATTSAQAGTANSVSWTAGDAASQNLRAQLKANPATGVIFNATVAVSDMRITLRWIGTEPSPRLRTAVQRSADKWRSVLVGRSGVSRVQTSAGYCRTWAPALDEDVDGILLLAMVASIDGRGQVLANANFCAQHAETRLPAYGTILVDEADAEAMLNDGSIDGVLSHEMGHSLGFHGGLIGAPRFADYLLFVTDVDPRFRGPKALAEFLAAGGVWISPNSIPLQSVGPFALGGHWQEEALGEEMMTPYVSRTMPLSRITVGLMEDIGYIVRYAGADPFSLAPAATAFRGGPRIELINDVAPVAGGEVMIAPTVTKVRK